MKDKKQLQLFGEYKSRVPSELTIKADRLTIYISARGDSPIPLEEDPEFWGLVRALEKEVRNVQNS